MTRETDVCEISRGDNKLLARLEIDPRLEVEFACHTVRIFFEWDEVIVLRRKLLSADRERLMALAV